jgi:hypothetical protein
MSSSIPILQKFNELLSFHNSSKINSRKFQPNEEEQKNLILHNISSKLISLHLKKEATKYLFSQRLLLDEEKRRQREENERKQHQEEREREKEKENVEKEEKLFHETQNTMGGSDYQSNKSSSNGKVVKSNRKPSNATAKNTGPSSASFASTMASAVPPPPQRRQSSSVFKDLSSPIPSLTTSFMNSLKGSPSSSSSSSSEEILSSLYSLANDQIKDSKKQFEFLCKGYDHGRSYQLHPKKTNEEIDLSSIASSVASSSGGNVSSISRLEDLNKEITKGGTKKDGILLVFDPSLNTFGEKITIRIRYMKQLDVISEEEVIKEYVIWSNGNYYGLKLMKEFGRNSGQQSPPFLPPGTPGTGRDGNNNNHSPFSPVSNSNLLYMEDPKIALPGWSTKFPIFIPANKATLSLTGLDVFSQDAMLLNNILHLKVFTCYVQGILLLFVLSLSLSLSLSLCFSFFLSLSFFLSRRNEGWNETIK